MKIVRTALLAAALVATAFSPARAAGVLDLAPADSEIVARVDVKKVVNSRLFALALEIEGKEAADAKLKILKNLTDLDVYKDIDEVALFGRIDDDESMAIVARGRFNQEKLLDLVRLNGTYKTRQENGLTIHSWVDDGNKQACFLPDNLLVVAGSEVAIQGVLNTRSNPSTGFLASPTAKAAPAADGLAFTAYLNRTADGALGDFAHETELRLATITADLSDSGIVGRIVGQPDRPELAPSYLKVAEGLLAAASLYSEEDDNARLVAETLRASLTADGKAVEIGGTMTNERFLELAKDMQ